MTLYLKYRPQTFDELDLELVRKAFGSILQSGSCPHAFLFTGPRGAGKTSAARILAKAINCEKNATKLAEPCNTCSQCIAITNGSHIDIIELDAASNRRIDDIRALKDNIFLSPTSGRKKIYILDEAHMLTTEAANALLKILEEPPLHVVFILATTEPQKLPETVRSRLTTIQFTKAKASEIKRQIDRVGKAEDIKIEETAIDKIAKVSDGSFRDAIKMLETLSSQGKAITLEMVNDLVYTNPTFDISNLLNQVLASDFKQAINLIEVWVAGGTDTKLIINELLSALHRDLLNDKNPKKSTLNLIDSLIESRNKISYAGISQLPLEIAIIKWSKKHPKKKAQNFEAPAPEAIIDSPPQGINDTTWTKILTKMRDTDTKVEALLRASEPLGLEGDSLNIGVYYRFHKERLENIETRQICKEVISSVLGTELKIAFALTDKKPPTKKQLDQEIKNSSLTSPDSKDIIEAAKEIFGN